MKFITSNTTRRVTVIRLLGKSEILGSAILNATAISPSTAPRVPCILLLPNDHAK